MEVLVKNTEKEAGKIAAEIGARLIRKAIEERGEASIILATGASQFSMLEALINQNIDWSKVVCFHLDEYIGISDSHPASFRKYLRERFLQKVGNVKEFNFINAKINPHQECKRLENIINKVQISVAFVGIGENGHLAFNDPPADFSNTEAFSVVNLDHKCRLQQLNEGWFSSFGEVPEKAISMSIQQIMKSKKIIATVPDSRKATAVKNTIEGPVSPLCPASIMQEHKDCTIILDQSSASLLNPS